MTLGVFTTCTRPYERGDLYDEAIACYKDLADEVIVNDHEWPKEFNWTYIGRTFQESYEQMKSDWVIHADLDFIFHEKSFKQIRKVLEENSDKPALSFYKYQFILPDRYNLKSRLVIAVNKGKYRNRIKFNSGGDLAQPSLDGVYISPDDVPEAKISFYNYEKMIKTKAQIADDVGRMERAYERYFGHTQYGSDGTDNNALERWILAQRGKFQKPQEKIKLDEHPIYIQDTIKNLKPENWGYNGFNELGVEGNDYV